MTSVTVIAETNEERAAKSWPNNAQTEFLVMGVFSDAQQTLLLSTRSQSTTTFITDGNEHIQYKTGERTITGNPYPWTRLCKYAIPNSGCPPASLIVSCVHETVKTSSSTTAKQSEWPNHLVYMHILFLYSSKSFFGHIWLFLSVAEALQSRWIYLLFHLTGPKPSFTTKDILIAYEYRPRLSMNPTCEGRNFWPSWKSLQRDGVGTLGLTRLQDDWLYTMILWYNGNDNWYMKLEVCQGDYDGWTALLTTKTRWQDTRCKIQDAGYKMQDTNIICSDNTFPRVH